MSDAKKLNEQFKKPKDKNLPKETYRNLEGVSGDFIDEYTYKFYRLQNEKTISKNDSYIVLGRDRPSNPISGYGGKGAVKSNSIDMVVGRLSCAAEVEKLQKGPTWVNPDFKNDAARIHISQRTDVDENFDLPEGIVGASKSKSSVAVKADSLRFVARSGIKIISGIDTVDSMGLQDQEKKGIDLIAGIPYDPNDNDSNTKYGLVEKKDDMQPIPKGNNLIECINEISQHLDYVTGMLASFAAAQMKYNTAVGMHTHISPFFGYPTTPSTDLPGPVVEVNMEVVEKVVNDILNFKIEHLPEFKRRFLSKISANYINSRYHHLN